MHTLHPSATLRPLERLLARDIDLTQLPEADDMDELVIRIEALEQQIQFTQQAMGARINALGRELAQARAQVATLSPMATLGSLTPALAHDLNTALGNSRLAAGAMSEQLDAFRQRMESGPESGPLRRSELTALLEHFIEGLRIVNAAGQCAGGLAESLKTVAIDSASERVRLFALGALVDDVLLTLRPALRQAQIKIEAVIDPALNLESQPGLLTQVLINLVQNAIVHAFDPATEPSQRRVAVHGRAIDHDQVELCVSDNGRGMTPEVRARVFTPYFTTRAGAGGSGIGLSHARLLVQERLGGTLTVSSAAGAGTQFRLTLPLTKIA